MSGLTESLRRRTGWIGTLQTQIFWEEEGQEVPDRESLWWSPTPNNPRCHSLSPSLRLGLGPGPRHCQLHDPVCASRTQPGGFLFRPHPHGGQRTLDPHPALVSPA